MKALPSFGTSRTAHPTTQSHILNWLEFSVQHKHTACIYQYQEGPHNIYTYFRNCQNGVCLKRKMYVSLEVTPYAVSTVQANGSCILTSYNQQDEPSPCLMPDTALRVPTQDVVMQRDANWTDCWRSKGKAAIATQLSLRWVWSTGGKIPTGENQSTGRP